MLGPFRIEEEPLAGELVVLTLFGDLDLSGAPELRDRLADVADRRPRALVIDLAGVEFVDSMGLGVLLGAVKRARADGTELRLCAPRQDVRRLFELTLLDRVFTIDGSLADALAAVA
jgi:anti-sigma B factor antagonist